MDVHKVIAYAGIVVLLLSLLPLHSAGAWWGILGKVESLVLEELDRAGRADCFVWMAEKADLGPAHQLQTKQEKGRFVYETLRSTAERTQASLRSYLDARGVDYRPFYVANKILIRGGDAALLMDIAGRPDVARITANRKARLEPVAYTPAPAGPEVVEPNISFIKADQAWALGYTGQGIVLAGFDTGLYVQHPALARHYRGCVDPPTCSEWGHDYNWWDASGMHPYAPYDGYSHGTHTSGTMVGDDGGVNQIGVAPGAQLLHCKIFSDDGWRSEATVSECFEWALAPWDLNGQSPRPDLAPDVINNSWGDWSGEIPLYRDEIQALHAAGTLVQAIAGNYGPDCATLWSPGDYAEVLTTGAVTHSGVLYPGLLTDFSGRGPSDLDGNYFPDVVAPGPHCRSSRPGGGYGYGGGTSAAGPHAAATAALCWSANPALRGQIEQTIYIITSTATPLTGQGGSNCGGDYVSGPNNDWGYGTIDALAVVQACLAAGDGGYLDGTVSEAGSGQPIAMAKIATERDTGEHWFGYTNGAGYYSSTLLPGSYTVTASAYGYLSETVSGVVVITNQLSSQDFSLTVAPEYVVSGTVTEAGTGAPLEAVVTVRGTPVPPAATDPATGFYSLTVAQGRYTFRVESVGHYRLDSLVAVDRDQTQHFELERYAPILLVDNDWDTPDVISYYTETLDNLGYSYEVWDIVYTGIPSLEDLVGRDVVIWFTGNLTGLGVQASYFEDRLAAYLESGGKLFLTSQDYLFFYGLTSFGQEYLGIESYIDDVSQTDPVGSPGDPIGAGLGPYVLTPPPGWGSFPTDRVDGVQGSPFRWDALDWPNSTRYATNSFCSVFFAWPFEGLAGLDDRSDVLGSILDWFDVCGFQQPAIVVEPGSLEAALYPNERFTQTLWISNVGGADLSFDLHEMSRTVTLRPRSEPVVDPEVWSQIRAAGQIEAVIYLGELADISPAYAIHDWEARGRFVYEQLQETAERSGGELFAWLEEAGAQPRQLLATNAIVATVDRAMLEEIAGRPEVALVGPNSMVSLSLPPLDELATTSGAAGMATIPSTGGPYSSPAMQNLAALWQDSAKPKFEGAKLSQTLAAEWNVAKIRADEVWTVMGITGEGVTVGEIGTGVMYNHAALVEQYRGNLGGGSYDHNYNWFDFVNSQPAPYDDHGHSTQGTGIMVGGDGGTNQIGVAPGAEWIAVKVDFTLAQLHAALDWMLAPTDLSGGNPDPSKRPQVGLNGWGGLGCSTEFQPDLQAWRAAGILPVSAAGNAGSGCNTVGAPGDLPEAAAAGATDSNDNIASFSGRGPSCWGEIKPEVVAPGVDIRSSDNNGGYSMSSGTSRSAAHLAGTAALVLSAAPTLTTFQVEAMISGTALCIQDLSCGGSACPAGANNVYGWGRIDAFEAVSASMGGPPPPPYDIPWLSEEPISGTVAPSLSTPIAVTFDAAGLAPGVYKGQLDVGSNDPLTPNLYVPVTLTVLPPCEPVTNTDFIWTPLTPTEGEVVTFTASASGTEPIAYEWEFESGDFELGNPIFYVFTTAGEYSVTLTATNGCGMEVVQQLLTVVPALPQAYEIYLPIVWKDVLGTTTGGADR